ncbi:MAG: PcfB family protein [Oscillospiraceae bacterium]
MADTGSETMAIVIKAYHLTSDVLEQAIRASLENRQKPHGKQSLDSLAGQGKLQNIEVSAKNIKSFEKSARAFGIDYAVKKIPDESPPKYVVFFRGKDTEQVYRAFEDYAKRQSISREKTSVVKEIKDITNEQVQHRGQHKEHERNKERGMQR